MLILRFPDLLPTIKSIYDRYLGYFPGYKILFYKKNGKIVRKLQLCVSSFISSQ